MKQITIVSDDKVGVVADISYILGKARINIEAISFAAKDGKAIVNLTVKDEKKAEALLSANGYRVLESEILVIKVKDEPGQLSEVSRLLKEHGINIESLYLLFRGEGYAMDALKVDHPKKAMNVLAPYLVKTE
ncbi:MAG: ACT domain-containing protein [Candidatus Anstonellaceae archaeon]